MARFRFTEIATHDLDGIAAYVNANSPAAAERLSTRIRRQAAFLAKTPGVGRTRPELRSGLRSFPVGKYILFYREVDGGIEVLRVLHGMRDLAAIFADDA